MDFYQKQQRWSSTLIGAVMMPGIKNSHILLSLLECLGSTNAIVASSRTHGGQQSDPNAVGCIPEARVWLTPRNLLYDVSVICEAEGFPMVSAGT